MIRNLAAQVGAVFSKRKPWRQDANPNYMASPYVPLDSWIYPALERLDSFGLHPIGRSGDASVDANGMRSSARTIPETNLPDNGIEEGEAGRTYAALIERIQDRNRQVGWGG